MGQAGARDRLAGVSSPHSRPLSLVGNLHGGHRAGREDVIWGGLEDEALTQLLIFKQLFLTGLFQDHYISKGYILLDLPLV